MNDFENKIVPWTESLVAEVNIRRVRSSRLVYARACVNLASQYIAPLPLIGHNGNSVIPPIFTKWQ